MWGLVALASEAPLAKAVPAVARTIVTIMRATANHRIKRYNALHLITNGEVINFTMLCNDIHNASK